MSAAASGKGRRKDREEERHSPKARRKADSERRSSEAGRSGSERRFGKISEKIPARAGSCKTALRRALVLAAYMIPAMALVLCAPALTGSQDLKDDLGRPFPLPDRTPDRIVSMAPNVTEILFALGLGERVVGVTRFCDYPPETRLVRKIGGLVDPNIEIIQSLQPSLVIAFRGNPLRLVERIGKLGLPVFVLDAGEGLEALFQLIAKIGRVTRAEDRAGALSAGLRRRLEAVDAVLRPVRDRPRVFVLLYGQGLWTCGGESYVSDLIARAGGKNIASSLPKKWALYKREQILRDDPEVVFILARSNADFAAGRDWLRKLPGVESVAAVRNGRVHELDENAAGRFGPRLADVLDRMARLLHPELFGEDR